MKKVRSLLAAALVLAMGTVQVSAFAAGPTIDLKDPIGTKTNFSDVIKTGKYPTAGVISYAVGCDKEDGMYFDVGPTVAKTDEEGKPVTDEDGNAVTEVKNDTFDGTTKYFHIPGVSSTAGTKRLIGVGDAGFHYTNRPLSYPNMSKGKIEFDIRIPKQLEFTNSSMDGQGFLQIDTEAIDENNNSSNKMIKIKGYYVNTNAQTGAELLFTDMVDKF